MVSTSVIPKNRSRRLRERIKALFRRPTTGASLGDRLQKLNLLLRGWGHFYRHAWGAKRVFTAMDHYVWWTILRWLRKKHRPDVTMKRLRGRYGWRKPGGRMLRWRDGSIVPFEMARIPVGQFKLGWQKDPDFV
jgi:hypothetical protein